MVLAVTKSTQKVLTSAKPPHVSGYPILGFPAVAFLTAMHIR